MCDKCCSLLFLPVIETSTHITRQIKKINNFLFCEEGGGALAMVTRYLHYSKISINLPLVHIYTTAHDLLLIPYKFNHLIILIYNCVVVCFFLRPLSTYPSNVPIKHCCTIQYFISCVVSSTNCHDTLLNEPHRVGKIKTCTSSI